MFAECLLCPRHCPRHCWDTSVDKQCPVALTFWNGDLGHADRCSTEALGISSAILLSPNGLTLSLILSDNWSIFRKKAGVVWIISGYCLALNSIGNKRSLKFISVLKFHLSAITQIKAGSDSEKRDIPNRGSQ